MSSTHITWHVKAPRDKVYRALIDPRAIEQWRVPDGMRSHVHEFEAREGGAFRISLTYDSANRVGKSSAHTDTYHGRFVQLVPNEQVVESVEFESADPALLGEMTVTFTLTDDADGGTQIAARHDGVPASVPPADNELGWRLSLAKLAKLVEGD
jgi:uncharacterized protein YndB with AHSA1/START domain